MPAESIVSAYKSEVQEKAWCEETYELGLFDHRREYELRTADALIEGTTMQLPPNSICLCDSIALRSLA
jgi:hypothetical protein